VVLVNDKVNSIKVIEAKVTGDADADLNALTIQSDREFAALWNLRDVENIIKELPKYAQETLKSKGQVDWRDWDIFYIPNKILCIAYQHGKNYKFYDLAQYFPDYEYQGVEFAEKCATELEHALHLMGIWPRKLTSPAAIFEDTIGKHLDLPTFRHFEDYMGLMEYAAECAGNEWNELFTIGHWANAYSYDLKSAYANQMAQLLDNRPRCMSILESDQYQPAAAYGYCKVDLDIKPSVKIHPILKVGANGELSSPVGSWRGYYTKAQLDFITYWKIGDFDILNGWWLTPKTIVKPLEHVIPRVLAFKEHDNPKVRDLAKWMVNGFGGKFNEEYKDRVGDLYNPMWHAEMVTRCAMQVCGAIYKEIIRKNITPDNIIQVKVDEFKTDVKLPTIPDGFKESSGECLAVSTENVFFGKQHPDGLDIKGAMELLTAHPNTGYYEKNGVVLDLFRYDVTRDFEDLPRSGKELLERVYRSKPKYIEEV
jgi:hypothetical protein